VARTPSQRLHSGSSLGRSPIRTWRLGLPYFSGDALKILLDFDTAAHLRTEQLIAAFESSEGASGDPSAWR
jgi:hypothetical protein